MSTEDLESVKDGVRQYILDEFLPGAKPGELTDSTPLITGGILDSLATVRVVAHIEERYGVEIQPHEASVQFMDTIADIASLVQSKR
jgi:acyl carrier protein